MFSRVNVGLAIRISVISRKRAGSGVNCVGRLVFDRPKLMCRRPFDLPSDLPLPVAGGVACLAFGNESVVGVGLGSGGGCAGNDDDDDGVERECFNLGIRTKLGRSSSDGSFESVFDGV